MSKVGIREKELTYLEAITEALDQEMQRDANIILMGEDIGDYGGAFKVTKGLLNKYGSKRVMDTPLAETSLVGVGIGAALMGLRPVIEIQYADFIHAAFDQIINVAAKMHYRSGQPTPLVIRAPVGAGLRAGPFHSASPETYFAHTPGLKVVMPATPYDAKGLLISSIRDNNPTIFFEHKFLYRRLKANILEDNFEVEIGKANVVKEGKDVSIITYGAMLEKALDAAKDAEDENISVEILDLRTISPLDKDAIKDTVIKTNKVIVLYEANYSFGVGAEVSSIIAEEVFQYLDGPIIRIASADTPVPYAPTLEDAYLPQKEDILNKIRELSAY